MKVFHSAARSSGMHFGWLLIVAISLLCASRDAVAAQEPLGPHEQLQIESIDLLALDHSVKALLERVIQPIRSKAERAVALHQMFFNAAQMNIRYRFEETKTAQETFDSGSGNCLSHAALYVAAARHVGLQAYFQDVEVPRQWRDGTGFYIVPGHVNVKVKIPGGSITVEFLDAFTADESKKFKSRRMSDREALGSFYNNRGAEALQAGSLATARAYLLQAVTIFPKFELAWSNLGIVHRRMGDPEEAERAYLRALKVDSSNLSILNNLYSLYRENGEQEKAQRIAARVEKYLLKNPYNLAQKATEQMQANNLQQAEQLLLRAIRLNPSEQRFHIMLGQTYFRAGELEKSAQHMKKAVDLAQDPEEKATYLDKLHAINHAMNPAS